MSKRTKIILAVMIGLFALGTIGKAIEEAQTPPHLREAKEIAKLMERARPEMCRRVGPSLSPEAYERECMRR
jgi:hypothetical protein